MRARYALPLSLLLFTTGVAVAGLADTPVTARWNAGDAATYSLTAARDTATEDMGTVRMSVGLPDWTLDRAGTYAWSIPLHIDWDGPTGRFERTVWWADTAVYSTLQGRVDDLGGAEWLDGTWAPFSPCPFAPVGCPGSAWPERFSGDLGPWFGSAGPVGTTHVLTRTSLALGATPWTGSELRYSLPPVAVSPARAWGPDGDGETEAPFAAFASDPTVSPVLEAGYVGAAWKLPFQTLDGTATHAWQFVATDGERTIERFVEPGPLSSVGGSWRVLARDETRADPGYVPDRFPLVAPTAWPTLDSVALRAAQLPTVLHGSLRMDTWGAWVRCTVPSCRELETRIQVGQGTGSDGVFLRVDSDGQMVSWHERSTRPLLSSLTPRPVTATPERTWNWPAPEATATIGAASLLVGLGAYFLPHLRTFAVAGFTRLKKDRLLEHPTRDRVMEAVLAEPGIHVHGLELRTGLASSTVRYHLRRLTEHGLILERTGGNRKGYWPLGARAAPDAFWTPERRAVMDAVRHGARSMTALMAATSRSRPTLIHHLNALEQDGAVRRRRVGGHVEIEALE